VKRPGQALYYPPDYLNQPGPVGAMVNYPPPQYQNAPGRALYYPPNYIQQPGPIGALGQVASQAVGFALANPLLLALAAGSIFIFASTKGRRR
jgi:hypothetical protein